MKKIIFGLAALATAGMAQASITPVLVGSPLSIGGGLFEYTYSATLASDQGIESGSYFTLYDFFGFAGFVSAPANFTGSTQLLGDTPVQTLPADDAGILNVTYTYSGPDFNFGATRDERELGSFVIRSTSGRIVLDDYTSFATLNNGPTEGTSVSTVGSNAVSVASGVIPEPTTWATMIAGLGLVGVAMRRRGPRRITA